MITQTNRLSKITDTIDTLVSKIQSSSFEDLQQIYTYFYSMNSTFAGEIEKRINMANTFDLVVMKDTVEDEEYTQLFNGNKIKGITSLLNRSVLNGVSAVQVMLKKDPYDNTKIVVDKFQHIYPDTLKYKPLEDALYLKEKNLTKDTSVLISKHGYGRVQEAGIGYRTIYQTTTIHFLVKQYLKYVESIATPVVKLKDTHCAEYYSEDPVKKQECQENLLSNLSKGFRVGFILDETKTSAYEDKDNSSNIEFLEAKGDLSGIKETIEMHDRGLISAISGGDIMNMGSSSGSRAVGEVQERLYIKMLMSDLMYLEEPLTQLLYKILKKNGITDLKGYKVMFRKPTTEEVRDEQIADRVVGGNDGTTS